MLKKLNLKYFNVNDEFMRVNPTITGKVKEFGEGLGVEVFTKYLIS